MATDRLLNGVQKLFDLVAKGCSDSEFGKAALGIVEETTGSRHAFLNRIPDNDGNPWKACLECIDLAPEGGSGDFLGILCNELKPIYHNGSIWLHNKSGLPQSDIPLSSFMAVPFVEDGKLTGMLITGNKPDGYSVVDTHTLTILAQAIQTCFYANRAKKMLRTYPGGGSRDSVAPSYNMTGQQALGTDSASTLWERLNPLGIGPESVESIIDGLPIGIVITDVHGGFVHMNRAGCLLTGRVKPDPVDDPLLALGLRLPSEQPVPRDLSPLFRALALGESSNFSELTVVRPDGSKVPVIAISSAIRDGQGEVRGALLILLDITERTELEAKQAELFAEAQLRGIELAEERERKRISRELHDQLGQNLTAISMTLAAMREMSGDWHPPRVNRILDDGILLLEESIGQTRNLVSQVRLQESMPTILSRYADSLRDRTGMAMEVEFEGDSWDPPPHLEATLYMIAKEALTNTAKHSGASKAVVRVKMRRTPPGIRMTICDNGRGFNATRTVESRNTFGMGMMRERAEASGITLRIESTPGYGTSVSAIYGDEW